MFFQAVLEVMNDGGSILQISSATAKIMLNDHAAYMGTKAGTDHVIRCIANEVRHRGIRANSISPGLTDTPMTAAAKTGARPVRGVPAGLPARAHRHQGRHRRRRRSGWPATSAS